MLADLAEPEHLADLAEPVETFFFFLKGDDVKKII